MKRLRKLALASAIALGVLAVATGGMASATTFEIKGVAQNKSLTASGSLEPGSSLLLKDSFGTTTDTCYESSVKGTTEGTFTAAVIGGKLGGFTISSCSHTTTTISRGEMSIVWTSGTNGGVTSSGMEVTVLSTAFGASAVCKTGAGTQIGTLTGVKEGNATLDVNAKISCGILGTASLSGIYLGTGGGGLGVVN